jgi:CHAT domain-containing protein/tetratricopeptide (TPR) repeat protein
MPNRCPDSALAQCLADVEDDAERRRILVDWLSETDAVDGLARLKDESERQLTLDPRAALRLARSLVQGAELAERAGLRALGLLATGDALRALGQCQEALEAFDAAARTFLAVGDEVGWARTRTSRLWTLMLLGRAAEGLADVESAQEILLRHEQWLRAGALANNLGIVFRELARVDAAIDSYDRALVYFERARQVSPELADIVEIRIAKTLANKAIMLRRRGDSRAALALHEASRAVFARHGDTLSELRENRNLADVYAVQGHFSRALRLFEETFASLERNGPAFDAAETALDLAKCYFHLNHVERALELAEDAALRFDRIGSPSEAAKARFFWAASLARQGDLPGALQLLDEAAAAFAGAGLEVQLANVALQRAQLQLQAGDPQAAIESARRARDLFAERRLVLPRCKADLALGRALLRLGELDQADRIGRAVLAACDEHELPWLSHEGLHLLASAARGQGEQCQAIEAYQRAIGSVEHVQGRVATELRQYFLGDKALLFHDAIEQCLEVGESELAFSFLERAKSRALVDYLNGNLDVRPPAPDSATRALLDDLTQLRGEHNWLYEQLHHRDGIGRAELTTGSESSAIDDEALGLALRDRERRMTRLLERLQLQRAGLGDADRPCRRDTSASWIPSLAGDAVLVEYFFGSAHSCAFVVTAGRIAVVPLSLRAARDVERLSQQWQLNLDATAAAIARGASLAGLARHANGILTALYRRLIGPVESFLDGQSRLIVVPYGVTHAVPFQALRDGPRFLTERLEVVVSPSSDLLRLCAARRRIGDRPALVVAHSDGGRLPAVVDEARRIAARFAGQCLVEDEATLGQVAKAAGESGLIHFAAHGEARLDNPAFAHLKLADGRLTTVDVFGLDLDGAVVTLSACETGRGIVAGGDELIGLSRGFLYAGAATLVQSMWRVEDGSTAQLMDEFYRLLRAGRAKGAALREAQLALLEGGATHPYYWGAFQLIGDSGVL